MPSPDTVKRMIRPAVKLIVAVVGLLLLRAMITLLPGGDRPIPGVDVTVESLLIAGFTLLIAVVVIYYGYRLRQSINTSSYGTSELRETAGRVILGGAVFVALLTAHNGLEDIIENMTSDASTIALLFDILFLLSALIILLALGITILRNFDAFIDAVTDFITGKSVTTTNNNNSGSSSSGGSTAICPDCGTNYPQEASFCADCGTALKSNAD